MNNKAYTLSTCDTSKRILKQANITSEHFEIIDIKKQNLNSEELDNLKSLAGSYEALFSRRAQKYKSMELKNKSLSELDYRDLILLDYTFLKRPVIVIDISIFIGNSKNNVAALIAIRCK